MSHQHHHSHLPDSTKNIKIAFFLNLGFTIIEIIGGILTNSIAIISDAIHDLGDSVSLGLAWYLENYSKKKGDLKFSYGYQRFSLAGALISGMVLLTGSFFVIWESVKRLMHPEPTHAEGMMALAILGILVNGAAALRLRHGKSMNQKMVSWHMIEDVLGWVAVLIVSIVLMFKEIYILDPILSILIAAYVFFNALKNLKSVLKVLMQGVPEEIDINQIDLAIKKIKRVVSTHHTHVWSVDGVNHVLTTHVVVQNGTERKTILEIKGQVDELKHRFGIFHTTVEIEQESEECGMKEPATDYQFSNSR